MTSKSERTISARGITLTYEQMRKHRIIKVINKTVERGACDFEPMDEICSVQNEHPGCNLLEAAFDGNCNIVSLIVFDDQYIRNVYAILNKEYYGFYADLANLYN